MNPDAAPVSALPPPDELTAAAHSVVLRRSLEYLAEIIRTRLALHFGQASAYRDVNAVPRLGLNGRRTLFLDFLETHELSLDEQVVLLLALAPHVQPDFFDAVIAQSLPTAGDFPQIGGVRGQQFRGFLPTGETALFLLAGDDLERRFDLQQLFAEDHLFARLQVLRLEPPQPGEPAMSGKLVMDPEYVERFTLGRVTPPHYSMEFPAQRVTTEMTWDDVVLPRETLSQIRELQAWVRYGDTLLFEWGMSKRLKRGYRALFHGVPGTGKTLTASLLGKYTGRDVYRVDLSMVVSKFIGETEKNLANLFNKAENKDWILFFDEADALFGKRTNVRDAHDKYANQEVAYLLQRVENYTGLVILASNFKSNIDDAFMRRFQAVIHFPVPKPPERLLLWQKAFPDAVTLEAKINLDALARKYEITGAGIMNVAQFCCLQTLDRGDHVLRADDIEDGIKRELSKEGKVV